MTAVDAVEAEVRELVRRRGSNPFEDRAAMRRLVVQVVVDYDERALTWAMAPLPLTGEATERQELGGLVRAHRAAAAQVHGPDGMAPGGSCGAARRRR